MIDPYLALVLDACIVPVVSSLAVEMNVRRKTDVERIVRQISSFQFMGEVRVCHVIDYPVVWSMFITRRQSPGGGRRGGAGCGASAATSTLGPGRGRRGFIVVIVVTSGGGKEV